MTTSFTSTANRPEWGQKRLSRQWSFIVLLNRDPVVFASGRMNPKASILVFQRILDGLLHGHGAAFYPCCFKIGAIKLSLQNRELLLIRRGIGQGHWRILAFTQRICRRKDPCG